MTQTLNPIRIFPGQPISDIKLYNDRVIATSLSKIMIPPHYNKYIEWGFIDKTLKVCQLDGKVLGVFSSLHTDHITCAGFYDTTTLITGGNDGIVGVWKLSISAKRAEIALGACLRGHHKKITCLAISSSYSIAISGSEDHTAIIWDLNRNEYFKTLGQQ